ncbi:MAG: FAD-dependent oxidoreductase, partial [Eubacteriales bacterium]|nr:FAD-dependent oxidoreductase [Eubacteriales bacterium]
LRGHRPVIYERSDRLGGAFIAAAAESYKGKLRDLLAWYRRQMDVLGVEINYNYEVRTLQEFPDLPVIIATGAVPRILRGVKGHEKMIEACDFLLGEPGAKEAAGTTAEGSPTGRPADPAHTGSVPTFGETAASIGSGPALGETAAVTVRTPALGETVAVIGGGLTGCEIAYELELQGKKPVIVEMLDDLIKQKGVCLANSSYLREYFAWKKVPVYLNTRLTEVKDGSIICEDQDGKAFEIPCDSVISCAGYLSAPIASDGRKNVQLIGDCHSVGNLRTVIWGAYEAAMII